MESTRLTINISKDEKQKLKVRSAQEGMTMTDYILSLIRKQLDKLK